MVANMPAAAACHQKTAHGPLIKMMAAVSSVSMATAATSVSLTRTSQLSAMCHSTDTAKEHSMAHPPPVMIICVGSVESGQETTATQLVSSADGHKCRRL